MRRVIALGLFLVLAVGLLGCETGRVPAMAAAHGEEAQCSGMLTEALGVIQREFEFAIPFILLAASIFLVSGTVLLRNILARLHFFSILLNIRSRLLRLYSHIVRLLAQGILHPQIY